MQKLFIKPYRKRDRRFKLKKYYIVKLIKAKSGEIVIPIPDDIVKAYHIEVDDLAIFEIINKNSILVKVVKKTMYSFITELEKER